MHLPDIRRVFLIVLDSVGAGALPDAADFGDAGAHTLRSVADSDRLFLPNLRRLGIGNIDGLCDGCGPGLLRMYQDYIDGRMELREVNMAFRTRYVSGAEGPARGDCAFCGLEE